jgi:prefoldin subunit 5
MADCNKRLTQCVDEFKRIQTALDGNGGTTGLRTEVYSMRRDVASLIETVEELKRQGVKVQRLIWIGFGVIITVNVIMKGDASTFFKSIIGGL